MRIEKRILGWVAALLLLPISAARAEEPPRLLVIAADAIPYGVLAELTAPEHGAAALFRGFKDPVPLISTFPSTSNLAFSGILEPLGVPPSPGYESRFFDRHANRRRGGGPRSYFRIRFPWRHFFDWRINSLWRKTRRGFHPLKSSLREVELSLEAFLASDQRVFFIYYGSTDLLGHVHGPEATAAVLRALDRRLERIRATHPGKPFHTVVFSDHGQAGGDPLRNARRDLKTRLKKKGFRVARRLRTSRDVVISPFGLISSMVIFTAPERAPAVARALAESTGVDLCVTRDGDGWRIESGAGSARFDRRRHEGETQWSYRPLSGDPLVLRPLLATAGEPAGGRWLTDRRWLAITRQGDYPDPFYRIARAFDLVANPASVICSLADGHMYGAARTALLARISIGRLRWTHGALRREASYGFLITDLPGWTADGAVRFSEALKPFRPFVAARPAPRPHVLCCRDSQETIRACM